MVYCSQCGTKSTETNIFCENCGSALIKSEYFNIKSCTSFNQLFTNENKKILEELSFSINAYNTIIENIKEQAKEHYEELLADIPQYQQESMDILSKIGLITLAFTKINYKSRGAELGSYSFNLINIDDRLDNANQISTLIHELTHHLVAEIFEQTLMYMLEVKKSDPLESFVLFALASPANVLMNEYCAHTVEGRFVPHGYQNFGSFNNILNQVFDPEKEEDQKTVKSQLVLGNSIAEDIIELLEYFISSKLREEIKKQYKHDFTYPPQYDQILLETKETLPPQVKVSLINLILNIGFEAAMENCNDKEFVEMLNVFNKNFYTINKTL